MEVSANPHLAARPAASTLMSAAALVLSTVALLNSLPSHGGHEALAREPPAEKRLAGGMKHVTLTELAVYQDNIAVGAVGTAELQDGAVTTPKLAPHSVTTAALADAAVTLDKLDGDVSQQLAKLAGSTGLLAGEVDEQGAVVRGGGFRARRGESGEYTLSFAESFAAPPIVIAVAQSYGICYVLSQSVTAAAVRVKCMSDLLGSTPVPANMRFSFFAHAGSAD